MPNCNNQAPAAVDLRPQNLGALGEWAAGQLHASDIENPRREARLMLAAVLGLGAGDVIAYPERAVSAAQVADVQAATARRAGGEPLSRILGRREFWSLSFAIGPDTLDPRPDSESLIEAALKHLRQCPGRAGAYRVLDLGTGSGCLLLALLSELPNAWGLGVDINAGALAVARENARQLGLTARTAFLQADWGAALGGRWDVILCNPPYICAGHMDGLPPAVRFDPRRALDGGSDGLESYAKLLPQAKDLLDPAGLLALEVGINQGNEVCSLAAQAGLALQGRIEDLSGVERCLLFKPDLGITDQTATPMASDRRD